MLAYYSRAFPSCKPYFFLRYSSLGFSSSSSYKKKRPGDGGGDSYQRTRGSPLSQESVGSTSYNKMAAEESRERHQRNRDSQLNRESEGHAIQTRYVGNRAGGIEEREVEDPFYKVSVERASCYKEDEPSPSVRHRNTQASPERKIDENSMRLSEFHSKTVPFDICKPRTGSAIKLKPSLLVKNKEKRRTECLKMSDPHQRMRPGMILLKNYLSSSDQVEIVKQCQKLGLGPGGFYLPGYRDGAKLHLQMMCLGKNWDPETRSYTDIRQSDSAEPPKIPEHFKKLVEGAIQTSRNEEDEIPTMSPDICIVNFYSGSGRLGLHQDRDESEESLSKGLPVVSFSLGDSADFLYGEGRDVDTAEKVVLKSGDVLIFGGKSRHIFHGISSIQPNTAPNFLTDDETRLKPGRLNLTFRKY